MEDLHRRGLLPGSFNCLALQPVFRTKIVLAPTQEPTSVEELAFPDNHELIGCTSGPLAHCLIDRLRSGAASLKEALSLWLLPRHAARYQESIEAGKILLWIRVFSPGEEQIACKSLLSRSANTVGVHDLMPFGPKVVEPR
jgi:hypothetical protein